MPFDNTIISYSGGPEEGAMPTNILTAWSIVPSQTQTGMLEDMVCRPGAYQAEAWEQVCGDESSTCHVGQSFSSDLTCSNLRKGSLSVT